MTETTQEKTLQNGNRTEVVAPPPLPQIRLNIGCGGSWHVDGWFGIDQHSTSGIWQNSSEPRFLDLDVKKGLPFPSNSVDVVFSSHTLEHFTYEEAVALLFEIHRVLKVDAPLCLVVPDLDTYLKNYIARNEEFLRTPEIIGGNPKDNLTDNFLMNFYSDPRFNNTCHKYAYNFENLSSTLRLVGFEQVQHVEYHDFSYWPELRSTEFRSPINHIERFSLSVQCRKLRHDPNFRSRLEFQHAITYSRFQETEQQLSQSLTSTLFQNEHLQAQLAALAASSNTLQAALRNANESEASLRAELQQIRERELLRTNELQELAQLRTAAELLRTTSERQAEGIVRLNAESDRLRADLLQEKNRAAYNAALAEQVRSELKSRSKQHLDRMDEARRSNEATLRARQEAQQEAHRAREEARRAREEARKTREEDREAALKEKQAAQRAVQLAREEAQRAIQEVLRDLQTTTAERDRQAKRACDLERTKRVREADWREFCESVPLLAKTIVRTSLTWARRRRRDRTIYRSVSTADRFDVVWYRATYPDVVTSGLDPVRHYLRHGAPEGRNPGPRFDTNFYLAQNPDVEQSGLNPLAHFVQFGIRENRQPESSDPEPSPPPKESRATSAEPEIAVAERQAPINSANRQTQIADAKPEPEIPAAKPEPEIKEAAPHLYADSSVRKIAELSASNGNIPAGTSITRYSPLISILIPTYNTPLRYLKEVIQSIEAQTYRNWELCIIDDGSTDIDCRKLLREISVHPRIRIEFSPQNEGIAKSSQRALEIASGEFIGFVDHDDMLAPTALAEAVHLLRKDPMIDMVYTDHLMMNHDGVLLSAGLKPGWSPEFFFSTNYLVHFKVVRRSLAVEIGGFANTHHIAQDIGLSCKLAERKARVEHLPKALYYWRTHDGSVASGTGAKPAIERASMRTYDDSLERRGIRAKLSWPSFFRNRRIGAYKLEFPNNSTQKIAVVVPTRSSASDQLRLRRQIQNTDFNPLPDIHFVNLDSCATQADFNNAVHRIDADALIFVGPDSLLISRAWLKELFGYLTICGGVGAVGGKILDQRLRVRSGGLLLLNEVTPICCGESDESDGFWYTGRIASNVEAVSAGLLATPKAVFSEVGGIPFLQYGDLAGVAYGLRLQKAGYRVVYNPWSKIVCTQPVNHSEAVDLLEHEFGALAKSDRYYHPFFSRDQPYQLLEPRNGS